MPTDQAKSDNQSQHNDKPDNTKSADFQSWKMTDLPPLPKARAPNEILNDLKALVFTDDEGLKLLREQMFTPRVMLPLAGDFYVWFGGPDLARAPLELGDEIDSRDIHPSVSEIKRPTSIMSWLKPNKRLPREVFDIGRLYLKTHDATNGGPAYQSIKYRVVLDMFTEAVWLFYEYHELDPEDDSIIKTDFLQSETLKIGGQKSFDSAMILNSIKDWNEDLTMEVIRENIKESGFMSHVYIAPALSRTVEEHSKSSRQRRTRSLSSPKDEVTKQKE
ncbi:uncharacterized protein KY384_009223 [Bacidia gigantensis]|uniref:uncharacterized protein n=1 Tax=Bacidia gigantensis TaxID=2732470 RepID=UPI001D058D62|nr:uncharacterized protein KY384_009223 [Bacidia gigantensis]KAG8525579.1 hypothetical protein KY384_009223 [Bacidia gigantensis]